MFIFVLFCCCFYGFILVNGLKFYFGVVVLFWVQHHLSVYLLLLVSLFGDNLLEYDSRFGFDRATHLAKRRNGDIVPAGFPSE